MRKKLLVSCLFNRTARFVPFSFMVRSISIRNLIRILFKVCAHFLSISNLFYICTMFTISLHVAVYGFYRVHMQVGSSYAARRKIDCLSIHVARFAQSHTLPTCVFAPLLLTVSTRLYLWLLKVHDVRMYLLIALAGREACKME